MFLKMYCNVFSFRYEFFNDLYHRFLSTPKVEMKCMCLQAMTIVYGRYYEEIGPFADTKYIVQMLDRVHLFILHLIDTKFSLLLPKVHSKCYL